jgi:hypothetical protein
VRRDGPFRFQCSRLNTPSTANTATSQTSSSKVKTTTRPHPSSRRAARRRISASISWFHSRAMRLLSRSIAHQMCQLGPGFARMPASITAVPVHLPDGHLAAAVLPQDVRAAVAVVIARPFDMPARSGVAETGFTHNTSPVHFPDGDFAAAVLPQDVGEAVGVEIAGAQRVPARSGIAEAGGSDHIGAVQLPDCGFTAVVLPQDVGKAVTVEVTRPFHMPARPRVAETEMSPARCSPERGCR